MEDSHGSANALDTLKSKLTKAMERNGISSKVAEITIIEPPALKGEHFATEALYAQLRFLDPAINREKNLFVKRYGSSPLQAEIKNKVKPMEKEVAFFNEFLPSVKKFCKRFSGCEDLLNFFPKCFYGDDECLVMENLVLDRNYIMLNKIEYQDLHAAEIVVTNLAKFHAANFAFIEDMGRKNFRLKFGLNITESVHLSKGSLVGTLYENGILACIDLLAKYPMSGSKESIQRLTAILEELPNLAHLLVSKDNQPFLVLNHGDCSNNNLLFQKNPTNGLLSNHMFVDLQITRYASPCLDLGYYFFTSVKPIILRGHYQALLRIYYEQFEETSKLMGSRCPITFEEMLVDFKCYAKFGYATSLSMAPTIGAFKEVHLEDIGTDPANFIQDLDRAVSKWLEENPDKAEQMARHVVSLVEEFQEIQERDYSYFLRSGKQDAMF